MRHSYLQDNTLIYHQILGRKAILPPSVINIEPRGITSISNIKLLSNFSQPIIFPFLKNPISDLVQYAYSSFMGCLGSAGKYLIILAPKRSTAITVCIFYILIWIKLLFLRQTKANFEEVTSIHRIILSSSLELSSRTASYLSEASLLIINFFIRPPSSATRQMAPISVSIESIKLTSLNQAYNQYSFFNLPVRTSLSSILFQQRTVKKLVLTYRQILSPGPMVADSKGSLVNPKLGRQYQPIFLAID